MNGGFIADIAMLFLPAVTRPNHICDIRRLVFCVLLLKVLLEECAIALGPGVLLLASLDSL